MEERGATKSGIRSMEDRACLVLNVRTESIVTGLVDEAAISAPFAKNRLNRKGVKKSDNRNCMLRAVSL